MANFSLAQIDSNLTLAAKNLVKYPPVFVDARATVAQAAQAMREAGVGSVLIATDPPGIVTNRDLCGRVLAAGLGADTQVARVMSSPLKTLDSDQPAFAALRLMLEEHIQHLPLVEEGKIIGVISARDLLLQQKSNPLYLRGVIDNLIDPAKAHYKEEIGRLVDSLFRGGLGVLQISEIVSSLNDALTKRLVQLAERALGPPSTAFAWIVFGSEGRLEQTLLTDQDNALIYAEESDAARSYFAELAKRVVDGLIQAGFPPCAGGFMATNWCRSLPAWQELFHGWINVPKPVALLDAAIFFDYRIVAGSLGLEPLEKIITGAKTERRFLAQLARDALVFHPPLGFFNRLRLENGAVDLKKCAIAPIVGLARVAALAAGSRERSTLERLTVAASAREVLGPESANSLAEIFPFFLQLRLRRQLNALQKKEPLDHRVNWIDLSNLERRHVKEAFVVIKQIQDDVEAAWQLNRLG